MPGGAAGETAAPSVSPAPDKPSWRHSLKWVDVLLLLFIAGLAVLPPIREIHKQLLLAAIVVVQLFESRLVSWSPRRGPSYAVLLKVALATILLDHTGEMGINSSYWPIVLLPVVTAATYFGPLGTLLWTALASAAYCSYLYPALQEYELTAEGFAELAIRVLFFFLAAIFVNRFAVEIRKRATEYQSLAEQMTETNRRLEHAQEEARRTERLAALGQMAAGLAHEIRNPLGVIRGSAEMLNQKMKQANPLAGELAGYILSETNRVSMLVARFLDFAKPTPLDLSPGNVAEVVDRALEEAAKQRPGAKVAVVKKYSTDLPPARIDGRLCEQVFINIALNAYDAMEAEGGTLYAEIEASQRDGTPGVQVTFRDTGPGIPAEICDQIFNPFFTTKKTGVGLGLAIVSKIVDEHHGSLRVRTEPGYGTSFLVFLPAEAGSSAPKAAHART